MNIDNEQALKSCPFCGGAAYMRTEHDPDGLAWHFIVCNKCGARSRGKWNGTGGDCPELRAEVRDEWNSRVAAPAAPAASELLDAAKAVVARWDSPLWKDLPHTGEYIHRLRQAVSGVEGSNNG